MSRQVFDARSSIMQVIGVTGGVGAGKSAILDYLQKNYRVLTLMADTIAHELMEPGTDCYKELKGILPTTVFEETGFIDRNMLSLLLFRQEKIRKQVNAIVHPAVKEKIKEKISFERSRDLLDYIIIEAALLIEDNYGEICDELWYVYASEKTRRKRLRETRGYSMNKIAGMFDSQLNDAQYREKCSITINNDGALEETIYQITQIIHENKSKGDIENMASIQAETGVKMQAEGQSLVFGLDIGTRNIVGTVGYKDGDEFFVMAQCVREHETRSMLDGQVHDIHRVGRTIQTVKEQLEEQIGEELDEVCIAAAGRVLKTVTTNIEYQFPEETVVEGEHVHTLSLLGIEKAQQILKEDNDTKFKFYCVGYSVVKYYLNDDMFTNLEQHKADKISEDIIVTFLPEDVVDGLYSSVGFAGLTVANLTLEPIAAIHVAIPEAFRMLNIAMVDIGAGTSDISITNDGSITAYGMIPSAGDEITETIVQHYLVDFKTAENIKCLSGTEDEIEYKDIMSITHVIPAKEVWELVAPLVEKLARDIAGKIKELNGGKTVSATFVVGGGGKVHDFTKLLADELELPYERVALRGEEVLENVHFRQQEIKKDPLLVTPIGICLVYYEQKNNFVFVRFNGERIKLYDNNKLTIVDVAMQAGFPNENLFPKRGKEINFTVNGRSRIARGEAGESALVKVDGRTVNINTPLEPNSNIIIEPSTAGESARYTIEQLEEYGTSGLSFEVNGYTIVCPKFVEVNGSLEPPYYEIKENDQIEMRGYYTVEQVMEFMDVEVDLDKDIFVNNRLADLATLVYENFSIDWTVIAYRTPLEDLAQPKVEPNDAPSLVEHSREDAEELPSREERDRSKADVPPKTEEGRPMAETDKSLRTGEDRTAEVNQENSTADFGGVGHTQTDISTNKDKTAVFMPTQIQNDLLQVESKNLSEVKAIKVTVNHEPVILTGKEKYIFVDVFDYISFDLQAGNGKSIFTRLNGETPLYTQELEEEDVIEIYWR
ncbi:dephospho-CoA kinase [Lachnospiraceae bacterium ZAX-1]